MQVVFGICLVGAWETLAADPEVYDAKSDEKPPPPTVEQVEKALELGEKFQAAMPPLTGAQPPVVIIPERYTSDKNVHPHKPRRKTYGLEEDLYPELGYYEPFWPCVFIGPFDYFKFRTAHSLTGKISHGEQYPGFNWWWCRDPRGRFYPHFQMWRKP